MKKIIVFGSGCANCHKLKNLVEQIVRENAVKAEVQYSDDFSAMAKLGIMSVPTIVIDNEIKSTGTIPRPEEILKWLQ